MGSAMTLVAVYLMVFSRKTEQGGNMEEPTDATRSLDPGPERTSRSLDMPASTNRSAYAEAVSHSHGEGLLSGIMGQLWDHMSIAIAKSVKESVEPMFKEMLPGPLASLRFTQLDLGTVPIRMDNVSSEALMFLLLCQVSQPFCDL